MEPTLPDNLEEIRETDYEQYVDILERYVIDLQHYTVVLQLENERLHDKVVQYEDLYDKIATENVAKFLEDSEPSAETEL